MFLNTIGEITRSNVCLVNSKLINSKRIRIYENVFEITYRIVFMKGAAVDGA